MSATPSTDRRQHQRHPLAAGIQFFHEPSRRDFPARSVDVSDGGMLMYVPVTAPVHVGHAVRLNVDGSQLGQYAGLDKRDATIVRVDRHKLIGMGHVAVGLKFGM